MLRSHILQRTHITITLNPLGVSSDVGESYVCVWRAYNYICDTTGSRYSCVVQGSYIHVCICVYLCVCMCETLCIFFSSVCANRSRLDSSDSKQASDRCEGEVLHSRP